MGSKSEECTKNGCYMFASGTPERAGCENQCRLLQPGVQKHGYPIDADLLARGVKKLKAIGVDISRITVQFVFDQGYRPPEPIPLRKAAKVRYTEEYRDAAIAVLTWSGELEKCKLK